MTGVDEFFAGEATVMVGERDGATVAAFRTVAGLASAGLRYVEVQCLQHEHVQVYHRGTIYNTRRDIDGFVRYARELRTEHGAAARPASHRRTAPTHGRFEVRDQGHAASALPPLVGRRFRLVTRRGRLVFGNWWLMSLDAETFELASQFGLAPPIGAAPEYGFPEAPPEDDHVVIDVWPTDGVGRRLDCVGGGPHTTLVHVPFKHDIALHLVHDQMSAARSRTDGNLRGVFG